MGADMDCWYDHPLILPKTNNILSRGCNFSLTIGSLQNKYSSGDEFISISGGGGWCCEGIVVNSNPGHWNSISCKALYWKDPF